MRSSVAWFAALAAACLCQASFAESPDPVLLLKGAAAAVASAPSSSVSLGVRTVIERDELRDEGTARFTYRTAPGGRFEFRTVDAQGNPDKSGFHVAGNGDVVMTAFVSRRVHMLEPDVDGFASFIRSPGAEGIGSGLGGMALALLNPLAAEELAASLRDSRIVGEEEIDGERHWRARYVVNGDVEVDVWYRAEGAPVVRRVVPNVLASPAVKQMGSRYEKFDYTIVFDFEDWSTDADLTAEDVAVREPTQSRLMASLYRLPPKPLHRLLGERAPDFDLRTADGRTVSLSGELASKDGGRAAMLLEFWTTTCPSCLMAMPALEKLHDELAEKGLGYVAVNVGEPGDEVGAFLEKRKLKVRAALDEDIAVSTAYGVDVFPLILLVGADGRVHFVEEGFAPRVTVAKIAAVFGALDRGENPAEAQLAEARAAEERRVAELDRLRSKLDG